MLTVQYEFGSLHCYCYKIHLWALGKLKVNPLLPWRVNVVGLVYHLGRLWFMLFFCFYAPDVNMCKSFSLLICLSVFSIQMKKLNALMKNFMRMFIQSSWNLEKLSTSRLLTVFCACSSHWFRGAIKVTLFFCAFFSS